MAESAYGRLANPEDFREWLSPDLYNALEHWVRGFPCTLTFRKALHGASGSYVAHVEYKEKNVGVGDRILKIIKGEAGNNESTAVQEASSCPPEKFHRHLIKTHYVGQLGGAGWWIHFQEVARGGINDTKPLSSFIDKQDFAKRCEKLVLSLGAEWNPGPGTSERRQAAGDFLKDILRGTGDLNSLLPARLSGSGASATFTWPTEGDGAELPNPMALMSGGLGDDLGEVRIFLGNGHGDLHTGNILIPVVPRANFREYLLIDLGRFSAETPMSRDPMKLLLSLAEFWLCHVPAESPLRENLAKLIVAPFSPDYSPMNPTKGYLEIAKKIHSAARKWAENRGAAGDWDRQNLLVMAASALRYAARTDLNSDVRWWFFGVAALATREMLDHRNGGGVTARSARNGREGEPSAVPATKSQAAGGETEAVQLYRQYLVEEFGFITMNGLPFNDGLGSKRIRIEDLYVPLKIIKETAGETHHSRISPIRREPIGAILASTRRLSVIGDPGSGKSTLIKRPAVAYADPGRPRDPQSDLPDIDWFPIVIRCRHLASPDLPFQKVLEESFLGTERLDLRQDFSQFIQEKLTSGRLLLLIDGLDEMSEGFRKSFVARLVRFLKSYPKTGVVLTSREAGFPDVADDLFSDASRYRMAAMTGRDIRRLVVLWHRKISGDSPGSEAEAEKLAAEILGNDKMRAMVVNPLLLTTFLLVRRWLGERPLQRTVVYQQAVKVLLETWNREGHEERENHEELEIDLDEARVQLGYAAYQMMSRGKTSATFTELSRYLREAREDFLEQPNRLRPTVRVFVERVEERSGLLALSEPKLLNGEADPVYEFEHLIFQEYFTALAIVNKWLPVAQRGSSTFDLLKPVLNDPQWSEIVAMAAVLSGEGAAEIVEGLIEITARDAGYSTSTRVACSNLISCLREEVQLSQELARRAITAAILGDENIGFIDGVVHACAKTRYYPILLEIVIEKLQEIEAREEREPIDLEDDDYDEEHDEYEYDDEVEDEQYQHAISGIADCEAQTCRSFSELLAKIDRLMRGDSLEDRIVGTYMLHRVAFETEDRSSANAEFRVRDAAPEDDDLYNEYEDFYDGDMIFAKLSPVGLKALEGPLSYVASEFVEKTDEAVLKSMQAWVIAWGGPGLPRRVDDITRLRNALFETWFQAGSNSDLGYRSAWAFFRLPLVGTCNSERTPQEIEEFLGREWRYTGYYLKSTIKCAVLIAGLRLEVFSLDKLLSMAIELQRELSGNSSEQVKEDKEFVRIFLKALRDGDRRQAHDLSALLQED